MVKEKEELIKKFILDHSEALFIEKGYKDTSMDLISQKCSISKPTLYNYFASKYDLYMGLYVRFQNNLFARVRDLLAKSQNKAGVMEDIVRICFSLFSEKKEFLRMMIREHHLIIHENIDQHLDLEVHQKQEIIGYMVGYLQEMIDDEMKKTYDIRLVAATLFYIIEGMLWDMVMGAETDMEKQIRFILLFMKNGLSAKEV